MSLENPGELRKKYVFTVLEQQALGDFCNVNYNFVL